MKEKREIRPLSKNRRKLFSAPNFFVALSILKLPPTLHGVLRRATITRAIKRSPLDQSKSKTDPRNCIGQELIELKGKRHFKRTTPYIDDRLPRTRSKGLGQFVINIRGWTCLDI